MRLFTSILFIISLTITGCSSISVTSDYDPETNFSSYKTFAVHEETIKGSALETAPLIKKRVIEAATSEMRKKGLVNTQEKDADLIVYPFAATKDKINVTDWGYSYGGYWGRYPSGRNIDVNQYTEASLVFDLVDNKTDQLLWRGIGTGVIHPENSPEERTKNINEAVAKIFALYPPQS